MTKLIFLDIDGVLNSERFYQVTPFYTWDLFDPKSVELLNELIINNKALLIIISNWRNTYGEKVIKKVFKKNDVLTKRIKFISEIDKEKGVIEFIKSMNENLKKTRYVILDDELPDSLSNLIKVNPENGFTYNDYKRANNILNKK